MIRIALDASGGDHAPDVPVDGALGAIQDLPATFEIILVGPHGLVRQSLERHGPPPERISIVDAPETIGMGEKPLQAVRGKRKSSIVVGLGLHKQGKADAFISAGNTGAVMAASTLLLGLHKGLERPAIGALLPTGREPALVMDAGANVDCSARELVGFAHLGAVYARDILERDEPRVGLLNIGEEEEKGNGVAKEAHALLKSESGFQFVGNVEGGDILTDICDVFVCDGFVGNVVLKFYESVGRVFAGLLDSEIETQQLDRARFASMFNFLDYSTYGGAPLLGVRGVPIICHGRSSPRAITQAIRVAVQSVERHLNRHIGAEFAERGAVA